MDHTALHRRAFLRKLGKWSKAAIAVAVIGTAVEGRQAEAGWINRRGGWGGSWINRGGGGWVNRGGSWLNRGGGGWINGGGGWINRRGGWGGGSWINRR